MMHIQMNGKTIEVEGKKRILDLIEGDPTLYQAARVNNRIRELNYVLPDQDCTIELLDLCDSHATNIYQCTLRYLVVMAIERVYPQAKVVFNYSVSRSIFASVSNINHAFMQEDLDRIEKELEQIIAANLPIRRFSISKEEARRDYHSSK